MSKRKLKGISPKLGNKVANKILKERIDKQITELEKLKNDLSILWSKITDEKQDSLLEIKSLEMMISIKIAKFHLLKYFVDRLHIKMKNNKLKYPKYKYAKKYIKYLDKELEYLKNKIERIENDK